MSRRVEKIGVFPWCRDNSPIGNKNWLGSDSRFCAQAKPQPLDLTASTIQKLAALISAPVPRRLRAGAPRKLGTS